MKLSSLDIITANKCEVFTGYQSAKLAALVFLRFGRDGEGALIAWRRLLQNSTPANQFAELVNKGLGIMRRESLGFVDAQFSEEEHEAFQKMLEE
jgi:hypothetical protein